MQNLFKDFGLEIVDKENISNINLCKNTEDVRVKPVILITGISSQIGNDLANLIQSSWKPKFLSDSKELEAFKNHPSESGTYAEKTKEKFINYVHSLETSKYSFFDIYCTSSSELDMSDITELREYINRRKPDYIINLAAFTNVQACGTNPNAFKVNTKAVEVFAEYIRNNKAKLLHVSTDFVYNKDTNRNDKGLILSETIPTGIPCNHYAIQKMLSEAIIDNAVNKPECKGVAEIVRVSHLFSTHKNNIVKSLTRNLINRSVTKAVSDNRFVPTYSENVAKFIAMSILTFHPNKDYKGKCYPECSNFVENIEPMSTNDLTLMIKSVIKNIDENTETLRKKDDGISIGSVLSVTSDFYVSESELPEMLPTDTALARDCKYFTPYPDSDNSTKEINKLIDNLMLKYDYVSCSDAIKTVTGIEYANQLNSITLQMQIKG
ncbi:gp271 [Sphingomonas phage PAU]|uniref:nucleotide-sugar epimerase n=1 Tax=Sphingomonas phage PAU TaxID=1150991 RepID=UPI0002573415|nr:nucleotide-sugar epimerase [Sphingomonas phage PAU]AFF28269.1 gp271 [Sphingomonas phage PAU]